jgi:hypothetical protein
MSEEAKEVNVEFVHTCEMIAEFFTKPLQGKQFAELKSSLLQQ